MSESRYNVPARINFDRALFTIRQPVTDNEAGSLSILMLITSPIGVPIQSAFSLWWDYARVAISQGLDGFWSPLIHIKAGSDDRVAMNLLVPLEPAIGFEHSPLLFSMHVEKALREYREQFGMPVDTCAHRLQSIVLP